MSESEPEFIPFEEALAAAAEIAEQDRELLDRLAHEWDDPPVTEPPQTIDVHVYDVGRPTSVPPISRGDVCRSGIHRPAYLRAGGVACGYCGTPM